ncbi:MAG: DUF4345 family protein [Alphaproteobacteria bacterium]
MIWRILVGLVAVGGTLNGIAIMMNLGDAWATFSLMPATIEGMSTIRADLGGLFLTFGVASALALWLKKPDYLVVLALLMTLVGLGRLFGLALDGVADKPVIYLVVEIVNAVIFLMAAKSMKASQS